MGSHRVGETGLSHSGPSNHHIPYPVFHGTSHLSTSFINQEGSAFDFGELEQAIALQGVKINSDEAKAPLFTAKSAATLEMFPSWPIRFHQTTPRGSSQSGDSTESLSSKAEAHLEPESPMSRKDSQLGMENDGPTTGMSQPQTTQLAAAKHTPEKGAMRDKECPIYIIRKKAESFQQRKGASSNSEKVIDAKTLRRLAQNREAAKKSRLRKKAYVQQLESSRIKLTQLEQDLQRARPQGLFMGGGGGGASGNISSGAAIFDMEYARWLDDDHRHMSELRAALVAHLPDGALRQIVDGYIAHYDEVFQLKGVAAKSDVFHLITGMWTSPAERCFLWMGGFRPSELIKMLITQLDPLTEQQVMGIYSLQQSTQQAEEALSQGLEQLQQSLVDTIAAAGGSVNDHGMHHMALALSKITNLEGFVRQADNLRQQTLHQLCRILTVRQAARCFLVIGEYYSRLRALSSLWTSRPREALISDENSCEMVVQSSQNHFTNF